MESKKQNPDEFANLEQIGKLIADEAVPSVNDPEARRVRVGVVVDFMKHIPNDVSPFAPAILLPGWQASEDESIGCEDDPRVYDVVFPASAALNHVIYLDENGLLDIAAREIYVRVWRELITVDRSGSVVHLEARSDYWPVIWDVDEDDPDIRLDDPDFQVNMLGYSSKGVPLERRKK